MCNLYSMTRNREAILRLFRVFHNCGAAYELRDERTSGYGGYGIRCPSCGRGRPSSACRKASPVQAKARLPSFPRNRSSHYPLILTCPVARMRPGFLFAEG